MHDRIEVTFQDIPINAWIYQNGCYSQKVTFRSLPKIRKKYLDILKKLGIPYKEITYNNEAFLEFWDSYLEDYEQVSGPLYTFDNGKYIYTGENHTETLPSENMATQANLIKRCKIQEYIDENETFEKLKEILNDNSAGIDFSPSRYHKDGFFTFEEEEFYTFVVNLPNGKTALAVFDLDLIDEGDIVNIYVPKHLEQFRGWIIGKGGTRINEWADILGLKRIVLI